MTGPDKSQWPHYPSFVALPALMGGICAYAGLIDAEFLGKLTFVSIPLLALLLFLTSTFRIWGRVVPALIFLLFAGLGFQIAHFNADVKTLGSSFDTSRKLIHGEIDWKIGSGLERSGDLVLPFRVYLIRDGIDARSGQSLPGKGRLRITGYPHDLCPGDLVSFVSRIRKPLNRGNPGEFDWELHCLTNDIHWLASARGEDAIVLLRQGSRRLPRAMVHRLREGMARFIEANSQGDVRAFLKGIVLGDRGELTNELRRGFVDSGLVHMLSASGLHVGVAALPAVLLTFITLIIFPRAPLYIPKKKMIALMSVPLMLLYCMLVGPRAPMARAMIMGAVAAIAIMTDRSFAGRDYWNPAQSFSLLASAGLLILLINPWSLFTIGFQLSFTAVTGILLLLPRIISFTRSQDATSGKIFPDQPHKRVNQFLEIGARSVYGIFKWFLGIFAITAAAQIILTPVLLAIFHKAPTYSLLSNLIATPALTLALPLALISSGIGSLWPGLGAIILWPAVWFIELIIQTAEFFSTLPHSSIGVQSFAPALFLGTLTFSIAILWIVGRGQGSLKKPLACLFSIIVVIGTISLFTGKRNDFLEVVFLNVGRADCAYIGTPGGASILVDTGAKYSYFDAGESIVIPFLRYFDVKRLNSIIISHMQSDHAGGLESILRATRVDRIYVSPYCAAKKPIIGTSAKIVSASHKLEPFSVHGVKFSFLNSEKSSPIGATESDRLNNSSVVLKVEYQGASFLFTGDIELETEKRLLDMGDKLRCDALKVSHHGSASSSSEAFLRLANPRIAVISCSWPQKRQLPADSVMDRLEEACEHVYWTGRDGAISLRTDGKMIRIKPARGRAFEMAL